MGSLSVYNGAVLGAADSERKRPLASYELSLGAYVSQIDRHQSSEEGATDIYAVPITLKWRSGLNWAKVAVNWVAVKGPGNVDTAVESTSDHSSDQSLTDSESGLGDLYLSAGRLFSWTLRDRRAWLQMSTKVKIPTADFDKGLGTGERDASVTGSIFYPLNMEADGWIKPDQLYAKLSYMWKGDPETVDLENRPSMTLGSTFKGSDRWSWGAHWQWEGRTVEEADPRQKLFFFASIKREEAKGRAKVVPFILFDAESPGEEIGAGVTFSDRW